MDRPKTPLNKRDLKPGPPRWNAALWYLPLMLLLLWLWQSTIVQFTYKTIPYSEFKDHLRAGEVIECTVKEDAIEGKIQPKAATAAPTGTTNVPAPPPSTAQKAAPEKKEFFFRALRVEDPKLVEELEAANVKFHGTKPGFFSQFLLVWLLPIGVLIL